MMSHVNSNKRKASQLIKIEKENENIELRKRMRSSAKDKHSTNKKETVWERLSKVKKIPSSENSLGITRSRNNLATKTSQRFQTIRQMVVNQPQQLLQEPHLQIVNCKPLSPRNTTSYSRRLNAMQNLRLSKAVVIPEIENQRLIYTGKRNKSVNEIMTARSLNGSKSSSDDYKSPNPQYTATISPRFTASDHGKITTNGKGDESSEDSNDEYKLAPLMSSRSHYDPNSSTLITNKFREVLRHRNKSMAPDDIELVKDVIKSDHRCRNLSEHNPILFKDILKTQLQDILKHEFAVKRALEKLESSTNLQSNQEMKTTEPNELSEIVGYTQNAKEAHKLEVDVIFKNVPSLEKEITILRALGEKLEATLRSTISQRSSSIKTLETIDALALTIGPPGLKELGIKEIYILAIQHYAQVEVQILGIVHFVGVVKEFCIAQKTIVELQQEANRPFYIPINSESAELKRTSFKKLKENPDILLRHIKAKSSMVAFNVLEQDPIFFNNILFNKPQTLSKQSLAVSTNEEYFVEKLPPTITPICEGGDSRIWRQTKKGHKTLNIKETCNEPDSPILQSVCKESTEDKSLKQFKTIEESVIRRKQRHRIRRCLTPMPSSKISNPKNSLFKTIFIGFLQMHLFILLIMAFTYPKHECL